MPPLADQWSAKMGTRLVCPCSVQKSLAGWPFSKKLPVLWSCYCGLGSLTLHGSLSLGDPAPRSCLCSRPAAGAQGASLSMVVHGSLSLGDPSMRSCLQSRPASQARGSLAVHRSLSLSSPVWRSCLHFGPATWAWGF